MSKQAYYGAEYQRTTIRNLNFDLRVTREKIAAQQAEIDMLMLEYCPEEMTEEQKENWVRPQVDTKT